MTPTQQISATMAQDAVWITMKPQSYAKWQAHVREAKERSERYKRSKQ